MKRLISILILLTAIPALAADSLKYGAKIQLEPRAYTFTSLQNFTDGTDLEGVPGKTVFNIPFQDSGKSSMNIKGSNVTLRGITFNAGTLWIDKPSSGGNTAIVIDNCEFHLQGDCGIKSSSNFNGKIINSLFTARGHSFGILGYGSYSGLVIANNEFVNLDGGVHWTNGGPGLLIEQNYFYGIKGQGLEIQGSPDHAIIQDNFAEHPYWQDVVHGSTGDTYPYTVPIQGGISCIVRRNVTIAPQRRLGIPSNDQNDDYNRIDFEIGGKDTTVEDNFVEGGGNSSFTANGFAATGVCRNNKIVNNNKLEGNNAGNDANMTFSNNGPNVVLTFDAINRGRPFRNLRYGDSVPPAIPTPPSTQPANLIITIPEPTGHVAPATAVKFNPANYWGPAEINQSNGEQAANDGKPLTIAGNRYARGYGLHAPVGPTFTAPQNAAQFFCYVGIDDETNNQGSVTATLSVNGVAQPAVTLTGGGKPIRLSAIAHAGDTVLISFANAGATSYDHVDVCYPTWMLFDPAKVAAAQAKVTAAQGVLDAAKVELAGAMAGN